MKGFNLLAIRIDAAKYLIYIWRLIPHFTSWCIKRNAFVCEKSPMKIISLIKKDRCSHWLKKLCTMTSTYNHYLRWMLHIIAFIVLWMFKLKYIDCWNWIRLCKHWFYLYFHQVKRLKLSFLINFNALLWTKYSIT